MSFPNKSTLTICRIRVQLPMYDLTSTSNGYYCKVCVGFASERLIKHFVQKDITDFEMR